MCMKWVVMSVLVQIKMQDNVRLGRQSFTKKISYPEKSVRPYRTIESLNKQPTRKKISLQQTVSKPDSSALLPPNAHRHLPDRKIKSLTKHDLRRQADTSKKRSMVGSQPELCTIDGLLQRNGQVVKFSVSRERERLSKQKYKRSEQVRSALEGKKMSGVGKMGSFGKLERKQTEVSTRAAQLYKSISTESGKPNEERLEFKDLNLEDIMSPLEGETTLEEVFQAGCAAVTGYLGLKEQRLGGGGSGGKTEGLKEVREAWGEMLERGLGKFGAIVGEAGEMSAKTMLMIGLVKHEQGRHNDAILYLAKVMERTDGNLLLIHLSDATEVFGARSLKLNMRAYHSLAESYRLTNNYLCAINALLKWQLFFWRQNPRGQASLNLKEHYQTLQPRDLQEQGRDLRDRLKKKSYLLSNLQSDCTANKFKKFSHTHNQSSIEFSKSRGLEGSYRLKDEEDSVCVKPGKDSAGVLQEAREYEGEITSIYLLLARLYVNIKSYQSAVGYYQKCLSHNPRKIQPILELASLYYSKRSPKQCLEWLQASILVFEGDKSWEGWQLDMGYLKYHKALVLLHEGGLDESYRLFCQLNVRELSSESNYYKGLIRVRRLGEGKTRQGSQGEKAERTAQIQSILMLFNQSIASFTSKQYLVKSYFQILLILLFEKKDYYGAQYEVSRFRKLVPGKVESEEEGQLLKSRIVKLCEQQQQQEPGGGGEKERHFSILFDLIEGVICVLKMKIGRGLGIFKEVGLRLQTEGRQLTRHYGSYYRQMVKLVLQFKFYAYYVQREYELSLKHVSRLLELMGEQGSALGVQGRLVTINRLMLECMILMRQGKFTYAMSKLAQIEGLFGQGQSEQQPVSSALILNNFSMVKALCYINIYSQLQQERRVNNECVGVGAGEGEDNNKEILLSAEELLRHCLISDKENSLIYYLISVIHYELESYDSSLKYIREALEFSDDHMIKHYFCKANTKAMLGRYDEAVKDYTNAIIVYKEQIKNQESTPKGILPAKGAKPKEDGEEYYQEKQFMFNEIYLNRAISYFKESYELSKDTKYTQNSSIIASYRMKAGEDLVKYFQGVLDSKIDLGQEGVLRERLLLFMHSDDPSQAVQIAKQFMPRLKLLREQDCIKIYYLVKELNNCIQHLKGFIVSLERVCEQQQKAKKESLPPKYKKISITLPKKSQQCNNQSQRIVRLKFDLRCLQALKKSSGQSQGALQQALISLLELTEEIYRRKEVELEGAQREESSNYTLQQVFMSQCGEIFKWSDILFFIGVIHYELREYQTAIKYFEESYNQKKLSGTLYSLRRYLEPILSRQLGEEEEEEYLCSQLEPLFQNRVYCKEELQYNLGVCYLLMNKYKQAYYYLQSYPQFLVIIKNSMAVDSLHSDNEFMPDIKDVPVPSKQKHINDILIAEEAEETARRRAFKLNSQSRQKLANNSISSLQQSLSAISQRESEGEQSHNITPFPTHNRLCSIYSPRTINGKRFTLSFCLPKTSLPLLGVFHEQQVEAGRVQAEKSVSCSSVSEGKEGEEEKANPYRLDRQCFESVVKQVSLLDLQMKPIAPWVKQSSTGIVFTENVVNCSIELNSERERGKGGLEKKRKERYATQEANKQ